MNIKYADQQYLYDNRHKSTTFDHKGSGRTAADCDGFGRIWTDLDGFGRIRTDSDVVASGGGPIMSSYLL